LKKILYILIVAILLLLAGAGGYRGYQWWENRQKRKELFLYLKEKSPVTRRLPSASVVYLNLYDFRRIFTEMRETKFYQVLGHWLDTGMSGSQTANPLLGGMLEKTILNVIGDEVAVGIVPSEKDRYDFVAIAKLAPGSDFLLRIALGSSKNAHKIPFGDETIYAFDTKEPSYPSVFVFLQGELGYASSNLKRLQQSSRKEGHGPKFLAALPVEAIPENTFLLMKTASPQISATMYGGTNVYRIRVSSPAEIRSHVPVLNAGEGTILKMQTNGTEIIRQPAASYLLEARDGAADRKSVV